MMVIFGDKAIALRNRFINQFVDKQSNWYHALRKQVRESNGNHYYGCLWDSLYRENLEVVEIDYVLDYLHDKDSLYVFWDNHPEINFTYRNPDWKYPKNCLLELPFTEWEEMIDMLPEDCYLFDDSLTWAIALTHEESRPGCRICYYLKG